MGRSGGAVRAGFARSCESVIETLGYWQETEEGPREEPQVPSALGQYNQSVGAR
jgi:hypothetical protein